MVRESLKRFIGKYPYFLDKNPGSVFYRTSDVNNRSIQRLYNELFKVYESFHIGKRLLVWREQVEDYNYKINFQVNYPNIKDVSIYKDDELIYYTGYAKDDKVDEFQYTYTCEYTRENIIPSQAYICSECGTIHISKYAPYKCSNCENTIIENLTVYQCSECDEIYFKNKNNTNTDCTINNHTNSLKPINIYKCHNCGEIYFTNTPPVICTNCGYGIEELSDSEGNLKYKIYPHHLREVEDYDSIPIRIYGDDGFETETALYKEKDWYTILKLPYNKEYHIETLEDINLEYGFIIELAENTNADNSLLSVPSYFNDETINMLDNRNVHHEDDYYIGALYKQYNISYNSITDTIEIPVSIIQDDTTLIDYITLNNNNNYNTYTKTLPTINQENGHVYNYTFEYDTRYNLNIDETLIYSTEETVNIGDEVKSSNVEIPIIPNNKFRIEVTTYDEYYLVKGYPENDTPELTDKGMPVNSIYDHDYSLDSFGALNNIPRKTYNIISDYLLYPFTEPPYNNRETEDDYHYMKRILEYNLRLWGDIELLYNMGYLSDEDYNYYKGSDGKSVTRFNPVSLELWKIYGLESELINRERYLLKVFDEKQHPYDEDTGLVKCWTPYSWEHKDKFCHYHEEVKPYFFTIVSTVRPLLYESVDFTFKVLDSHGDDLDLDFYVDAYKITNDGLLQVNVFDGEVKHITESRSRLPASYLNTSGESTNLIFIAYNSKTDAEIGRCDISVIVRDSSHADWYVDQYANIRNDGTVNTEYKGDGSEEYPFLTLQEALSNVSRSNDLICLSSRYVDIPYNLTINTDTNIIGKDLTDGNGVRVVPRIRLKGDSRRFFTINGGKRCKLKLGNLRLMNDNLSNYIQLQEWFNTNKDLNSTENVMIHGGSVNLTVTPSYNGGGVFPFDFLKYKIQLSKGQVNPVKLSNQKINIYYHDELIDTITTDENGESEYLFNLKEYNNDSYHFDVVNESNLFFESQITTNVVVNAMNDENYRNPVKNGQVTLNITNKTGEVNVFNDLGETITTITIDNNGEGSSTITNIPLGKRVWYTTIDNTVNGKVDNEWIIESVSKIKNTTLLGKTLIKDLTVDDSQGYFDINYDTIEITEDTVLGDLDGLLLDLSVENNNLIINDFTLSPVDDATTDNLLYSDIILLKDCVSEDDLKFNDNTGELTINHIGDIV